jgi:hypothetical protein
MNHQHHVGQKQNEQDCQYHTPLAPKVALIITARGGESKAMLSSGDGYFPKTATVQWNGSPRP